VRGAAHNELERVEGIEPFSAQRGRLATNRTLTRGNKKPRTWRGSLTGVTCRKYYRHQAFVASLAEHQVLTGLSLEGTVAGLEQLLQPVHMTHKGHRLLHHLHSARTKNHLFRQWCNHLPLPLSNPFNDEGWQNSISSAKQKSPASMLGFRGHSSTRAGMTGWKYIRPCGHVMSSGHFQEKLLCIKNRLGSNDCFAQNSFERAIDPSPPAPARPIRRPLVVVPLIHVVDVRL